MKNNTLLLVLLVLATFFLSELTKYLFNTNDLVFDSLLSKYNYEEADSLFSKIRKWQLLTYLLIPIFFLIKTNLIAIILNIGSFFMDINIDHKYLLNIVLKAEFVFIIAGIIKILVLISSYESIDIYEIQQYSPLSLANVLDLEQIPLWYHYPLQVLSLFELGYIAIMIYVLAKKVNLKKAISIISISYLPALLFWIGLLVFIQINIT
ncbi:MAG: hypothetical protein HKP53_08605 [Eudoraea sp.]|nr:hypothetical protein [Eudoraea sp.]